MHSSHFKNQHFTRRVARSGFTLIEIVVALAIFVIGALAIIQIFPPALNVVRGSERRTTATQMARTRVSNYENSQHIAPDAIYTVDGGGNWLDPKNSVTNDALMNNGGITQNTIPRGPTDNINDTTLGNFKHIRGEKQKVKFGDISSTTVPYVLTQFPYSGNVLAYTEDTLSGVTVNSTGYLDFSQAKDSKGATVSDSSPPASTPTLAPPNDNLRDDTAIAGVECEFYVTYRYDSGGRVMGVVDEPLLIPDDSHASWTNNPAPNNRVLKTAGVIPGSVTVRIRKLLSAIAPGSATPASPVAEPLVGLVRLDGLSLNNGDSVSLDYDASDWRNIVLDEIPSRPLDGASPGQWNVLTPMQNLNPEATIVAFFERPNPAPTPSQPVLGGLSYTENSPLPPVGPRILDANLSAGRITYDIPPVDAGDPIPTTPTRTVLNTLNTNDGDGTNDITGTLDGWGHQFTVAAASYVPYEAGQTGTPLNGYLQHPRQGWREYVLSGSNLFFQASEAGKLVMVDYEYSLPGGGFQTVRGAILPISVQDSPIAAPAGFAPISGQAATVTLTTLNGQAPAPVSAITAVRGVSIAARTAWIENGRYQQVVTKGYRPLIPVL